MKKYLFLMFSIFIIGFSSCYTPPEKQHCKTNDDCKGFTCIDGICLINKCLDLNIECGKGKCMPLEDDYFCSCDAGAVLYEGVCVPECSGFSQECRELFKKRRIMTECNMELGHCDNKCSGKGSCEDGYYCSDGGSCNINDYPCETDDDCKDNPEDKTSCYLKFNTCFYAKDYCRDDSDCNDMEDKRTVCNTQVNRCTYPDVYCVADFDCKDNPSGKTVCDTEVRKCVEAEVEDYTKSEFSEDYATAYCTKYGLCRDAGNENMEQCIAYYKDSIENNLNDEYCEIFNGNSAKEIVNCINNYTCTGEDDNTKIENECVRNYYAYMCKDTKGKNEASIKYSKLYCNLSFTCNESVAINKFGDIENCKDVVSGIRYKDFQNGSYCENFNREFYGQYLNCVENLTCDELSHACQSEFTNACGNY